MPGNNEPLPGIPNSLAGSDEHKRTTAGIERRPLNAAEMSSGIRVSTPGSPGGMRVESDA